MSLEEDLFFMQKALEEARAAFAVDEVPVGAVLVWSGQLIARGHNRVETLQDATAHAEMEVLSAASLQLNRWRLTGATLYCTLEPCVMCAGAMLAARIDRLVWGAKDLRLGANGSWFDLFQKKHPMHTLAITSGLYEEESQCLMRQFFQKKRSGSCPACKN